MAFLISFCWLVGFGLVCLVNCQRLGLGWAGPSKKVQSVFDWLVPRVVG